MRTNGGKNTGKTKASDWLRVSDVATLLGVSANTVRRWTDDGVVRCRRSPGGHRRYLRSEVLTLLSTQPASQEKRESSQAGSPGAVARLRALADAGADLDLLLMHNPQETPRVVARRLCELTAVPCCDLYVRAGAGLSGAVRLRHGQCDNTWEGTPPDPDLWPAPMLASAEIPSPQVWSLSDASLTRKAKQALEARHCSSLLSLPLGTGGRLVGLAALYDSAPRDFAAELEIAADLSRLAAHHLDAARLLMQLNRRATAGREMAELGGLLYDPPRLMNTVTHRIVGVTGALRCAIYHQEAEGLRCLAAAGRTHAPFSRVGDLLDLEDSSVTNEAVATKELMVISGPDDRRLSKRERQELTGDGLASKLIMPLCVGDRLVGLIDMADDRPRDYAEHLDFVVGLAQIVAGSLENAQLVTEVEQRNTALRELVELGEMVSQTRDLDAFVRAVAERLFTIAGAADCDIWRHHGDQLRCLASYDHNGFDESLVGKVLHLESYPALTAAIENNEPLVIADLKDPRLSAQEVRDYGEFGFQSVISIPLSVEGRAVGLVELYDTQPRDFAEHYGFLLSVTQLIAGSFDNATMLGEVEERSAMQRQVLELGELISQTTELDELARIVANRVRAMFDVEACDIWRVEGAQARCLVSIDSNGDDESEVGQVVRLDEYPGSARSLVTNEPFVFADLHDPRLLKAEIERYGRWNLKSGVSLPLVVGDHGVGMVDMFDTRERDYNDQLDFMRSIGQLLAGAFEKTALLGTLRQRMRARRELIELGEIVSQTLDIDRLARTVARRLLSFVGAACCDIYRLDGERLYLLASELGTALRDTDLEVEPVRGLADDASTSEALATGQLLVIASLDDPRLTPAEVADYKKWGTRSALCVPLVVEGRAVGLIELEDVRERDYAEHLDFARNASQLVAGAFAKAMLLGNLEQRVRAQRELVELGEIAARSRDLEELQQTVARRLFTFMDAASCDILRVEGEHMRCVASAHLEGYGDITGRVIDWYESPTMNEALTTGEPLVVANLDDPRLTPAEVAEYIEWGSKSSLTVPLVTDGKVVGMIDIDDVRERDYAEHLDFARSVGQLLTGAFAKAIVLDDLEQRVRAQCELVELGEMAAQTRDLEELQRAAAQRLYTFMHAASCDIWWAEGERWRCVASACLEGCQDVTGQVVDLYESTSIRDALEAGEPVVIADLDDPRLTPSKVAEFADWGAKSCITVPLLAEGKLVGTFDVCDIRERDFAEYPDFARNVGQLLSGAFVKAHLLDRLEEGTRELHSLVDAGLEFGASLEVGDVLSTVATRILAVSEADMCDIYRLDDDQVELLVALGGDWDQNPKGERYPASDFAYFAKASEQQQPLLNLDVLSDPETTDMDRRDAEKWGYRSMFNVPLVSRADVIGFVVLYNRSVQPFAHQEVIVGLTQIAAQAIVNASLYRQVDDTAQRMALISESGMELSASLDLRETLMATAKRLRTAVDVPDCEYLLTHGVDELHCLLSLQGDQVCHDWNDRVAPLEEWPLSKVCIEERRPAMFSSLDDPRLSELVRQQYAKCNETAGLALPLIAKDEVVGTVELLETRGERIFSEDDIATAEAICRVAALAIDNARLYENLQATSQVTALVNEIAQETTSTLDMAEIAAAAVSELQHVVPFERANLMLLEADAFSIVYSTHPDSQRYEGVSPEAVDRQFVERLAREKVAILDLPAESPFGADHPTSAGLRSAAVVALSSEGELVGVLDLASAVPGAFDKVDCSLLERVGTQLSLALNNARLYGDIKRMHLSNLKALSSALNAKDYYTLGHAARVSAYMVLMGQTLGWPEERIRQAEEAAYLHDIGKIGISDRVLLKPGKLNAEEWELMRQHPVLSADIIQSLFGDEMVLGVRHHHERYDGKGYPDGLAGEAIPQIARAMCVVDSYDAMSYQRTYRSARTYDECLAELAECRGRQFDPDMVDTFLKVLHEMEERRMIAMAAAEEAAARVDPDKHALLTSRDDEARPEYDELCLQLREVRDAHPPVRFITTHAKVGDRYILVGDAEEDTTGEKSHLGEEIFTDDDLRSVLAGERVNMNTLLVDEFGVWINALATVRDRHGETVAIIDADLPPFAAAGTAGLRSDGHETLAAMLQTAAARMSRAEVEAISDGLTGLYNHRYLHERLAEEIERAREQKTSISLLFCNLDHFKQFNEARGHSSGDKALRNVAHVLEQAIRRIDLAARFGGKEFVLVLIDTTLDGALEVAERVRKDVHQVGVALDDDAFTISIGVASFPGDAGRKEELLDKAEWAMHLAKRRGRDQIVPFAEADAGQFPEAELDHVHQA